MQRLISKISVAVLAVILVACAENFNKSPILDDVEEEQNAERADVPEWGYMYDYDYEEVFNHDMGY